MHFLKKYIPRLERGDTIVEVMFASATAALLIVIALSFMNRGLAQTQMTVESTFVRQGMDSQAEALRYARDQWLFNKSVRDDPQSIWNRVLSSNQTPGNPITQFGNCDLSGQQERDFYIAGIPGNGSESPISNPNPVYDSNVVGSDTFAYPGHDMWVEARNNTAEKYVDLHIRACWQPPFDGPVATLGTIIRLQYRSDAIFNSDNSTLAKPTILFSSACTSNCASATSHYAPPGGNSTVSWSNPDGKAASCSSTNFPAPYNAAPFAPNGSFDVENITSPKTYELSCTGTNGAYTTQSLTITVVPTYSLTVVNPGNTGKITGVDINCGQGSTSCTRNNIPTGTAITLNASAASGYMLGSWNPANCGSFNINSNKTCSASFNVLPPRDPLYRCYQYYLYNGNYLTYTNHLYMANGQGGAGYGCYPGVETNDPRVHYETIQGYAPKGSNPGVIAIYGGFDPVQYDNFYTDNYDEYVRAHNGAYGTASGFQFWAYPYPCRVAGTTPLYRWYSSFVGNHYYSTSATFASNEPNTFSAVDGGGGTFDYEGVIGCIFTGTSP